MSRLFVEQLTVIDCARLDAARGLVGDSWIVDVELEGDLDGQSMVLDFGEVKKRLKRAIDGSVDHSLLVPRRAPQLRLDIAGDDCEIAFAAQTGTIEHRSPACAVSLLDAAAIDTDAVVAYLRPRLMAVLPASVAQLYLQLRPERIDGAHYHYVHGLKKHAGLCQRIAHGHRSRIEIRVDGQRDETLERQIADGWRDIYLGTRDDVVARSNGRIRFAYTAAEGAYALALPEDRVDLLDTDSTVEQIAAHLAHRLAPALAARSVSVRAYEGVMKGAVATVER
jgi:6-pyruvoyl-tetrahydropterin synthase